jgi:bifunctional polynucleotide phosphatase/kinase
LKSIVEGYDNLKDEDQNKLERDLPKYCKEAVAKATEQAAGPKPQMAAEYAKSAKSSCKGCSKNIGKNVLRLGFFLNSFRTSFT